MFRVIVCVCVILRTIKVIFWRFSSVPFTARACTIDRHGRHLEAVLTSFFQPCERQAREKRRERKRVKCMSEIKNQEISMQDYN